MQLLLISPPHSIQDEERLVSEMLALGLARFHLRKPEWDRTQMLNYVAGIPARFHSRLVLHSHHSLVSELGLGGVHLTAAIRIAGQTRRPTRLGQTLSTSFHSLAEINQHRRRYDYVFLSPIFNSLSKQGYEAAFDLAEVAATLQQLQQRASPGPQVIALGGIEGHRLSAVRRAGFAGAAVLGAVWQQADPVAAFRALQLVVS
jgi:thiamine-phosphate pyrophosphorylase